MMGRRLALWIPDSGKRRRFVLFSMLAVGVMLFAWMMSALPPAASGAQSSWLQGLIQRLTGLPISEFFVRKMAHFTEYLMLGLFLGGAARQLGFRRRDALLALLIALLVALVDETIQIFSARGPSVVDVWIDLAGAALGLGIARITRKKA